MKNDNERVREVAQTRAIEAKAEELRKAKNSTARHRDALIAVAVQGRRTPAVSGYLNTLKRHRPGHYVRFLEDEQVMVAYAASLAAGDVVVKEQQPTSIAGNVVFGAFPDHARSQQRRKAVSAQGKGMSPLQRAMLEIGIAPPNIVLRRVK
ncbi:hypothetical protein BBC27_04905 [Acidithiobacillus ferrivorans]|uniref:Uncharacterized protein n=1 Tax=Acidithiobacillus ferrivorans TaxID=160808 RepID=A0A1B9BU89_9PROT|nr:hypothetical protein [Acidithiobacillus ferrivorans]OCB01272.1 hypothetical protein BBC27_04905 [Acidithiobacillus ferrivorans]